MSPTLWILQEAATSTVSTRHGLWISYVSISWPITPMEVAHMLKTSTLILMISSFFTISPLYWMHSAIAFLSDWPPTADNAVYLTYLTYPWPTFVVSVMAFILCTPTHAIKLFLTDLLFSSPWLWFLEQQKKAVLNWATQLSVQDVPTYHVLSQFQENIKNTVRNSVISIMTGAGHKVYMQDIPHLIAKVCLTPSCIDLDLAEMLRAT